MGTKSFGDVLSELSRVADEAAQVYRAVYGTPSAPDAPASGAPVAAPSPAATPAAYVPKVGDVVGIDGGNDYGETRVVTAVGARVTYARLNYAGKMLCDHTMDVSRLTYLRPATAAERAAAGLPVDESATKPVDREGLRVALRVTEAVFNANDRSVTPDDCERGQAIYCAALNAVGYDKTWSARSVSSFIDHLKAKLARGGVA